MYASPLEYLARRYDNVIKYDDDGCVAGVFVKFYKCKSSDLAEGLPEHTHPAFIIDGVEQDYILLGKYKAGPLETGSALYSLPNIRPMNNGTSDSFLTRIRRAGTGITGMTCADYGFIKLLAQKNGWEPRGNTRYGMSHLDGTAWQAGASVSKNAVRGYDGWLYTCLKGHTTSAELKPDIAPEYWQRGKFVGGVSLDSGSAIEATYQAPYRTINGTGPKEWYLGGDTGSVSDIIGSSFETNWGYRIVDCELQILENNNAANPNADMSASSAAWRAILPNAGDDGYTLVTPGTEGALHWNWTGSAIQLDTRCDNFTAGSKAQNFRTLTAHGARLPYVPHIVKELGLFPTGSGDNTPGNYYLNFSKGEYFPRRGGSYSSGSLAGLGYVASNYGRSISGANYGCRPRSLP